MINPLELAPPPWRVSDQGGGRIEDAKGQPVAWIAVRLNLGDESWRVIANKLAAAAEMEIALERMLALFGKPLSNEYVDGGANYALAVEVIAEARIAIAHARGETPT